MFAKAKHILKIFLNNLRWTSRTFTSVVVNEFWLVFRKTQKADFYKWFVRIAWFRKKMGFIQLSYLKEDTKSFHEIKVLKMPIQKKMNLLIDFQRTRRYRRYYILQSQYCILVPVNTAIDTERLFTNYQGFIACQLIFL